MIAWLASYPKSGNTWFRILVANYFNESAEPLSINQLDNVSGLTRQTFGQLTGLEASELRWDEIQSYLPSVFLRLARHYDGRHPRKGCKLFKVHGAYSFANGEPIYPPEAGPALYLVRNPLDVAISIAHFFGLTVSQGIRSMENDQFHLTTLTSGAGLLPEYYANWSQHVRSWADSGTRVRVIRYEDMLDDTPGTFRGALQWLGFDVDEQRLHKAVEFSKFEVLRAQESQQSFREGSRHSSFFRVGRAGGWQAQLTNAQRDTIIQAHGAVMERFGYLPK